MARRPSPETPIIAPVDGLRQRQRANGDWRVWWEPTARQRAAGATALDLTHIPPGEAQRRATALFRKWSGDGAQKPRGRSVSALIADYRRSHYFTDLAASSQASYRTDLGQIEDKWGPNPVASLDAPAMVLWYETLLRAKGVTRARALIVMLGIVMTHAERRGWIPKGANPCRDIGMKKPAPANRVASADELAALLAAADATNPAMALALRLAQVTGQRATDIRLAKAGAFEAAVLPVPGQVAPMRGYVWRLVRSKRGNAGVIPILDPATVAALDARIAACGPDDALILNGAGQPYSRDRFQKHYADIRARAAKSVPSVASLQWRDQRRTVGVMLRAAGVGRDDVGDLLGNTLATNAQLAAIYTPATTATTLRAVAAITPLPKRKKA